MEGPYPVWLLMPPPRLVDPEQADKKVNMMTDAQGETNDEKMLFLQQLVNDRATFAADVFEVDPHTWAIHGFIPVGGDVIMAEFETEDEAKTALGKLSGPEYGPPAP